MNNSRTDACSLRNVKSRLGTESIIRNRSRFHAGKLDFGQYHRH